MLRAAVGAFFVFALIVVNCHIAGADLRPGDIVVSDPTDDALYRVDPVTGATSIISSGGYLYSTHGIALDANGQIISVQDWADSNKMGKIVRVDPATGAQTLLLALPDSADPWDGIVLPDGDIIFSDYGHGSSPGYSTRAIRRLHPANGSVSIVASGGFVRQNLNILLDGNTLYVSDHSGLANPIDPRILAIDLVSGQQRIVSQGGFLTSPFGIARDPLNGSLVVADYGPTSIGKILRIDPITGAQQVISQGGILQNPSDLVFEGNHTLLVTDTRGGSPSALLRIDTITGAQSLVAQVGSNLWGIVIVPEPGSIGAMAVALIFLSRRRWRQSQSGRRPAFDDVFSFHLRQ